MADLETAEEILDDLEDLEDDDLEEIESLIEDLEEDDDLEMLEEDDDLEAAERRRRRRRRRRAKSRRVPNLFQARLKGLATKNEVKALGRRTRAEIQRVNRKVTRNTNRIRAQSSLNSRQSKAIKSVRKDVDDTKQLFLLTSLLGGSDRTLELTAQVADSAGDTIAAGTKLEVKEAGDKIDRLLPLLLVGGLGGKGGGMTDNPLMLVLLLDALG